MSSELNLNFIKHDVNASDITNVLDAAASATTPISFNNINILDDNIVNGVTCPCFM